MTRWLATILAKFAANRAAARAVSRVVFSALVTLSLAVASVLSSSSNAIEDGDATEVETVKAVESWSDHSLKARIAVRHGLRKSLHHVVDRGHDSASHAVASPVGHRLANGLRAPLRC